MNVLHLKEFREKYNIDREEQAKMLGITIDTLNNWEYRTKKIPKTKIKHIEYVFNTYLENKPIENIIANEKENKVPYYDIDVTSSITRSFSDVVEEPSFYVDYQPFNDCTAYVNNYGDSMFPKYKNGERLAVKQVFNLDIIMWGETYLVITNENADNYKAVKDIHPHENLSKIILRSSNPAYKGDTPINKEDIIAMFAVKGKISQNFI
ncbi:MAG: hypothetical protein V3V28_09115 [Polaribacter sp.]|uniref:hypothetical protein n=1 Tax=Polaribacter sp. TaxID=1920175 RepID=UPI002F355AFF